MENAPPVVRQDWRALWKIKSAKPGTMQVPDHTPTSIGNPALLGESSPTVEPLMARKARKRKRARRKKASGSTATSAEASPTSVANLTPLSLPGLETSSIQTGPCQTLGQSSSELDGCNQGESRKPPPYWIVPISSATVERLNRRLILQNLPLEISMEEVTAMVPEETAVRVFRKPAKGESNALLEFASEALADDNHQVLTQKGTLNGQTFTVDFSGPKGKLRPKQLSPSGELDKLTLYVSGLKLSTSDAVIRKGFPTAINVYYSGGGRKRRKKRSKLNEGRGENDMFAFVHFATESAASEALSNGQDLVIDGQKVTTQFAYKVTAEEAAQKDLATTHDAPDAEDDAMGSASKKRKTQYEEHIKTEPGQEDIDAMATGYNAPDAADDTMGPAVKKQKTENGKRVKTEPGRQCINDGKIHQEVSALVNDMVTAL